MQIFSTKGSRVGLEESEITSEKAFGSSFDTFKTETNKEEWPFPLKDDFIQLSELPIVNSSKLEIFIRIVTWNQQAKTPTSTEELKKHLFPISKFDVIAIGCQECENTMAMSVIIPSKTKWEGLLKATVGSEYDMICTHALQAIHV